MTALRMWKGAVQPGAAFANVAAIEQELVYTEEILSNSASTWARNDCTIEGPEVLGPAPYSNGFIVQATTQAGVQQPWVRDTAYTLSGTGTFTIYAYVRAGENSTYPVLQTQNIDTNLTVIYDVVGDNIYSVGLGTPDATGIVDATTYYPDAPAGWYFIYATFALTSDLTGNIGCGITELTTLHRITGPTTADRCAFWGFGVEKLSTPSGIYVPTTGNARRTTGAFNNDISIYKGAVQPAKTYTGDYGAVALAGIRYPRDSMATEEQRFKDFITAAGIAQNDDLQDNYKAALAAILGLDPDLYSIDDLFKRYWLSL